MSEASERSLRRIKAGEETYKELCIKREEERLKPIAREAYRTLRPFVDALATSPWIGDADELEGALARIALHGWPEEERVVKERKRFIHNLNVDGLRRLPCNL